MASGRNGTIYTGQTDDLLNRVHEHKNEVFDGFSKRYHCKTLVWFELHNTRKSAKLRERRIKEWRRTWKLEQIEKLNPQWKDLSIGMTEIVLYDSKGMFEPPELE